LVNTHQTDQSTAAGSKRWLLTGS